MHGIREVTEEFYGSLSSKKPFNCLEELEFSDMPEWKQWHLLGSGEFPTLEKLDIINCPELSLETRTPVQLSSLKSFQVIRSPKVGFVYEGMKQIEELYIGNCKSVTSFPFSILPTTLKRLEISGCPKLKLDPPFVEMFLEELSVVECDCIDDISAELLPTARELSIRNCHNLTRFSIPTATETLFIQNCENVEKLSGGGTQMSSLTIWNCKKLKWLPQLLPFLKHLYVDNCPEIESFPQGGLQRLIIWNCKTLVSRREEWTLPCLTELWISHDEEIVGGENWELPTSIQILSISNLKTLSSQHLKSLTSLRHLCVKGNLPQIQSMLEQGQFSHLTSLQCLRIMGFRNLQSLAESALPSSLSHLDISHCPNLQSLGMPSSLSELSISNCPLLTPLLEFDKGEYWPQIAHISTIQIDEECL
ncbi:putative disease resistance protein isoform X1 [Solanum lycopersicum]|uniref:putative disease resistance protein isoform X1 n=1 Tax=Solanum lycopersicum TaxID=4081 RepID=UPI003749736C